MTFTGFRDALGSATDYESELARCATECADELRRLERILTLLAETWRDASGFEGLTPAVSAQLAERAASYSRQSLALCELLAPVTPAEVPHG